MLLHRQCDNIFKKVCFYVIYMSVARMHLCVLPAFSARGGEGVGSLELEL